MMEFLQLETVPETHISLLRSNYFAPFPWLRCPF